MTYVKKVNKINSRDREIVRESLAEIAESIRGKYPDLTHEDLNRFLRQMVNLSV